MNNQLTLQIIVELPVSGVAYGLQKGKGNKYETIQKQIGGLTDLVFEFPVLVKSKESGNFSFSGPFVQGPSQQQFIYIDIGTYAGQIDSQWSRRLKIPLTGISNSLLEHSDQKTVVGTRVPGTGKDGSPNCATVKPFSGWTSIFQSTK